VKHTKNKHKKVKIVKSIMPRLTPVRFVEPELPKEFQEEGPHTLTGSQVDWLLDSWWDLYATNLDKIRAQLIVKSFDDYK
jgi:hypothetical protein